MKASGIQELLQSRTIGREILVVAETGSTNDLAAKAARNGTAEGWVVFAERQLQGRGRFSRNWESQAGMGLTFSILLRPAWTNPSRISMAAALAVSDAVDGGAGVRTKIKWPNDIYLEGRKIAGILCEATENYLIVGIGLNVLQKSQDFPPEIIHGAGSVAMFSNASLDLEKIAAEILTRLDSIYATLPNGFPGVLQECEKRGLLSQQTVEAQWGEESVQGRVTGLDVDGGLKILTDCGREMVITSGEVTQLKFQP